MIAFGEAVKGNYDTEPKHCNLYQTRVRLETVFEASSHQPPGPMIGIQSLPCVPNASCPTVTLGVLVLDPLFVKLVCGLLDLALRMLRC